MAVRTVSVKLQAEVAGYIAGIKQAGTATKQFADDLGKHSRAADDLSATTMRAGLVLAGGFALVASRAAAFDKAMDGVHAATQAGAADMQQLSDAALEAGKTTAFSAGKAAGAEEELAKAGVSVRDILGGGLKGALNLAAAGQLDVGDAAEYAASAMTQFGLSGQDLPHVADLLAASAGKAQGEVKDVGEALKMSGLVASQFGLSIEETTGSLAAFASAGLIGSDAGTSLKTMLLRLAAPTGEAADTMKQLGINAYDAQGQFVGMTSLAGQLQNAMSGMSAEQRNAAMSVIFGADAIRAANVLYVQGTKGMGDWINKVNDTGFAAQVAAQKTDNLAGDLDHLKGALDATAIQAGGGVNEGLRVMTQSATGLVNAMGQLPPVLTGSLTVMAGLGGAALLATAGLIKVISKVKETRQSLDDLSISGSRAERGISMAARGIGRLAAALTVTQVAGAALGDSVTPQIDALSQSLIEYGQSGEMAGEMSRAFSGDVARLDEALQLAAGSSAVPQFIENITGLGDAFDDSVTKGKERLTALDTALAGLVKSGHVDEAMHAYGRLGDTAGQYGVTLDQLAAKFPQYIAAIDGAKVSSQQQADAVNQEKVARIEANNSLSAAIDLYGSLQATYDAINGPVLNFREAQRQAEQAIDDVKTALDASNGSLSIHTQKGREAAAAVDAGAKSAANLAQKKYEETGSIEKANGVYNDYIGQLRSTMRQAGLSKDEVDRLIKKIGSMPAYKSTTLEVKVKYVDTGFGVQAYAEYYANSAKKKRWGGITEHARTGLLRDADVYRAGSSPLYAFAEPATQGEAFVPKSGDYGRSMSILSQAAGWYGARVVPGGSSGGSGGEMTVRILVDGTGVLSGIRQEITARSGDPDRELRPVRRRP